MSEELEKLDSQNQDVEENNEKENLNAQSQEDKNEKDNDDDKITLSASEYKKLIGQKEYYQSQYKKTKQPAEKQVKNDAKSDDRTIVLELRQDYPELTKEDALEIAQKAIKVSTLEGKSIDESLNDEYVKTFIDMKLKQKASEDASISSSRSPRFIANNVEFKAGMSDEDHKKAWAKANGLA